MNKVRYIHESTVQLIDFLEKNTAIDRDEKIKKINEFLELRDKEMIAIVPPFSVEEIELGRSLVLLNKKLASLLDREKLLIQRDIKELHSKKESNKKYTNPYENLVTGGVFYDKRN